MQYKNIALQKSGTNLIEIGNFRGGFVIVIWSIMITIYFRLLFFKKKKQKQ